VVPSGIADNIHVIVVAGKGFEEWEEIVSESHLQPQPHCHRRLISRCTAIDRIRINLIAVFAKIKTVNRIKSTGSRQSPISNLSIFQSNFLAQLNKPQVGAQQVEYWFDFDENHRGGMLFISLCQPLESLILIAKSSIYSFKG